MDSSVSSEVVSAFFISMAVDACLFVIDIVKEIFGVPTIIIILRSLNVYPFYCLFLLSTVKSDSQVM